MIGKLTGRVDSLVEGGCIFDVNGVGYLVSCSSRSIAALPQAPGIGSLWIETVVREDAIILFGFADTAERDWFKLLTGIQGVGPKVALSLLSSHSPSELAGAIMAGDKGSLTRAAGVGAKLAVRLVSELRERVGGMPTGPAMPLPGGGSIVDVVMPVEAEVLSALTNLGYRRAEAQPAIRRALERVGEEASLPLLIRESLKELAPK
ncbi:Holliday junction branch migration protein RuvA [Acetobacteraceae bacterium H6797]|nr:Holliday junction branch migration protein RuvA [Acetobacteraceae bacterium H6797]